MDDERDARVRPEHALNRAHWDAVTPVHVASDLYDMDAFLAGADTLDPADTEALADVDGKSLLHLQCHFGMDTLSWARRGARVTGVDFSEPAITEARALAARAGLAERARWVVSDVLSLELDEEFDFVYTGRGAIYWLSDPEAWGQVVARHLKPGGTFFMQEFHPTGSLFDQDTSKGLRVRDPYFATDGQPLELPAEPDYADPSFTSPPMRGWLWTIADVLNALWHAGLVIEAFAEHPFTHFKQFDSATQDPDGRFWLPDDLPAIPLSFDVKAVKPQ